MTFIMALSNVKKNNKYNDFTVTIGERIADKMPETTCITYADYTEEITWFAKISEAVLFEAELNGVRYDCMTAQKE